MSDQIPMSEAVRHLMAMNEEVVSAKYIAPILRMSESVIVKYAKDGTWDQDHLGKFVISGGHVKFFRKDFLQKCGFMEPEKETEDIQHQLVVLIAEATEHLKIIERMIACMMTQHQRDVFQVAIAEEVEKERAREKTAGAATPTD